MKLPPDRLAGRLMVAVIVAATVVVATMAMFVMPWSADTMFRAELAGEIEDAGAGSGLADTLQARLVPDVQTRETYRATRNDGVPGSRQRRQCAHAKSRRASARSAGCLSAGVAGRDRDE